MSVEIIRVEEPKSDGWGDWLWEQAKDRPYWALPFVAAGGAIAAPFIATTAAVVGGAFVGGSAVVGAVELWRDSGDKPPPVTVYTSQQALTIFDVNGTPLQRGTTYLRHPKRSEHEVIVRSPDFHNFIMSQKVSEVIDYMRSELLLESLKVLVRTRDNSKAFVSGQLEAITPEAKLNTEKSSQLYVDLKYSNPERQAHRPGYVWINDFPEVVAATRNAKRGTVSFSQSTDMSFGLSAGAAAVASFQTDWLSSFVLEIEASFA